MVRAYHIVFGCYGFWLPNDPRGSWSTYVGSRLLRFFGPATKTSSRNSVAHAKHDVAVRLAAKNALKFTPVRLTGQQALLAINGFADAVASADYRVLACSIMPDHVHAVVCRHQRHVRRIAGHFKSMATRKLREEGWPAERPVWTEGSWAVFLNTIADVERAIRYVENNPIRDGLRRQRWSFLTPFEGFI